MSWRRYVFLHRIHPHSILIGFSLLHQKKKKKKLTEVRGGMNHGWGGVAALGFHSHHPSYAASPLWPSQYLHHACWWTPARPLWHCAMPQPVCMEPFWTMEQLTFFLCCLWLLHRNIIMLLNLNVSQWLSNIRSAMDRLNEPQRWDGERLQRKPPESCVWNMCGCEYKYGSEPACVCVRESVCCMLMVDVQAWRANARGCSR